MLEWLLDERRFPLWLLTLVLLAHGLLFPLQGFYWDDFPISWIAATYGSEGLERYFSTNRPLWGLFYQFSAGLLGDQPWVWQVFGLGWRWLSAVLFWLVLRQVWKDQPRAAGIAALALAVYPGFGQQTIGRVYGHFFWMLSFFFFSLYAGMRALSKSRWRPVWLAGGLLAGLVNLITVEYFFLLELARPLLIGFALRNQPTGWRARLNRVGREWLPYGLVFTGAAVWRAFFFPYQTNNYTPRLLDGLRSDFGATLAGLVVSALEQIRSAAVLAWSDAMRLPGFSGEGLLTIGLYAAALAGGALVSAAALARVNTSPSGERRSAAWQMLAAALFWLAAAGVPFYVTGLPVRLEFPNDRFTLAFMPGGALLVAALIEGLPLKVWVRIGLAAALIGSASGKDFLTANAYRRDWELQKSLFWQLVWRAPGLVNGTILMSNDLPLRFYSDNSITAPLNWIYAPENRTLDMGYHFLYPTIRLGSPLLPDLRPGIPVAVDYLAAHFSSTTDRVVALYFQPPACLRVVDGAVEAGNQFLPLPLRRAAENLSSTAWILAHPDQAAQPPEFLYGREPVHGWCYYYQKADLARQQGDWQSAAAFGDQAFGLQDYPNDPAERFPFIEAYAHVGRWEDALEQTRLAADVSPAMPPVLCHLWQRIALQTGKTPHQQNALHNAAGLLGCDPFP